MGRVDGCGYDGQLKDAVLVTLVDHAEQLILSTLKPVISPIPLDLLAFEPLRCLDLPN